VLTEIHKTAIVHPKAQIGKDVVIGPYAIIGENVKIGSRTKIGAHVVIEGWTEIGEGCTFFHMASVGTIPQDLKFSGEETRLKIGRSNTFREFVTLNRGTQAGGGETVIGDHNFMMAYVHIAHDCQVGSHVIMANAATLAGHIHIGDYAVIGGLVGIHQFVQIGAYSLVGGCSAVAQDVPPFMSAAGVHAKLYGLNLIGLKRHGFTPVRIRDLKKAYRILFRSKLTLKEAIKKVQEEIGLSADIQELLKFVEGSKRGICR
jgi:UDP-N-acetylglucosamine acyltransferase